MDGNGNQSCARFEGPPGTPSPCLEKVQEEVELLSRCNSGAGLYPQMLPASGTVKLNAYVLTRPWDILFLQPSLRHGVATASSEPSPACPHP